MISIHASREGGDKTEVNGVLTEKISIHASREGGDQEIEGDSLRFYEFQSTPPVREATYSDLGTLREITISIHASREGGDALHHQKTCIFLRFVYNIINRAFRGPLNPSMTAGLRTALFLCSFHHTAYPSPFNQYQYVNKFSVS